jgi:DNA-binding response OmpR family regulator
MADQIETKIRKVVCIDDEEEMVELITLMLKVDDFEVAGAFSGESGLELIRDVRPDVVLLDLMMPEMNGWQVYQQMRRREDMRTIPVVIVTAKSQPIDEILARGIAKVNEFIVKPFSPSDLIDKINSVLGDPVS